MFFQTIFYIIHRAADQISLNISLTKMYSQSYFRKLGTHAEQCRYPHPKNGARPTDGDRSGHPGNISGSNCCRQCRTDRLKWRHGSIGSLALSKHSSNRCFYCIGKFSNLQKMGTQTQIQTNTDDADHRRHTPDKTIDCAIDHLNGF